MKESCAKKFSGRTGLGTLTDNFRQFGLYGCKEPSGTTKKAGAVRWKQAPICCLLAFSDCCAICGPRSGPAQTLVGCLPNLCATATEPTPHPTSLRSATAPGLPVRPSLKACHGLIVIKNPSEKKLQSKPTTVVHTLEKSGFCNSFQFRGGQKDEYHISLGRRLPYS